jgi:beta-ribofuranosylaminobenzene 5'-phosphate synthase
MPIPELEILQTLALIYHGLAPGFLRVDLRVAADALRRLQRVGFKRREIDGQTDSVRQCLGYLLDRTQAPVGMSSMGPLLYVLRDVNDRDTAKAISEVTELTGAAFLGTYPGQNEPYVISGSLDDDR